MNDEARKERPLPAPRSRVLEPGKVNGRPVIRLAINPDKLTMQFVDVE